MTRRRNIICPPFNGRPVLEPGDEERPVLQLVHAICLALVPECEEDVWNTYWYDGARAMLETGITIMLFGDPAGGESDDA